MNKAISHLVKKLSILTLGVAIHTQAYSEGKLVGVISVDWEGYGHTKYKAFKLDSTNKNIIRMKKFREDHPNIGLLQFLNAAYYTKDGADHSEISATIWSVLKSIDEHGLHIHGWKSLVEASGVSFRTGPLAHKNEPIDMDECQPPVDCGHTVNIGAYNKEELKDIVRFSKETLEAQGFSEPVSFRTGGWLLNSSLVSALSESGIRYDSSAVPPELFKKSDQERMPNLYKWVQRKWGDIDTTTQPYTISREGELMVTEIPDNGILADYITGEEMFDVFKKNVELFNRNPSQTVYISIGFHQETADKFLDRIDTAIRLIEAYAEEHDLPFEWAQLPISNYLED